jgi:extracellular factor (EF) 3-hydroxypalmitic acid methyl ester biosynthesis protein
MMVRDPYEGASIFAKVLNRIFLSTPPVEAHRDRLVYLTQLLREEAMRHRSADKPMRVFNMGCGPAKEIQDFLKNYHLGRPMEFTLVDFNDETLQYTTGVFKDFDSVENSDVRIQLIKKSVNQLLKEAAKYQHQGPKYDIVYCAGLFDYLPDTVCRRLLSFFYDMLNPGGLMLATNVDISNPSRGWMEYVLDWHLVYRTGQQLEALAPAEVRADETAVRGVGTGVNVVLEVRKPRNA